MTIHAVMMAYARVMSAANLAGPGNKTSEPGGVDILLTGTFYADNWLNAHIKPIAMARSCRRIIMVSSTPLPPIDKVEAVYPPPWMIRIIGAVPARLLTFFRVGLRYRPHIVGGFHLLFNGLAAALLGRMTGARSLYFCVGGPAEVLGGGIDSENRLFSRLETPDDWVEKELIKNVSNFDLVITMGGKASRFFKERGVRTTFHVISGGIDLALFNASGDLPSVDLMFIGRLSPIKRVDLFLDAIRLVKDRVPDVKAMIVGDGPLRTDLERKAEDLGLGGNVSFAGHRSDVQAWLRKARLFVLTSDSEGLSLALMEAMSCGLPAVVSDVGDLGELVESGINGYLVNGRNPEPFAERIVELLLEPERLATFSKAARASAQRFDNGATTELWERILSSRN
jgi:glycosyltransferase involved in cell wall biosynthesis